MKSAVSHALRAVMVLSALALPTVAHADVVTRWHDDVTVERSGTVAVKETIVYDPQDNSHHGIARDVPAQFTDTQGRRYYTRLTLTSVTDETGHRYPIAEKEINRDHLYLRIGQKDTLISGPHTYVITYSVTPLVVQDGAQDRLLLNVVGNGWQTPIKAASATVQFAPPATLTRRDCFTGLSGQQGHDCTIAYAAGQNFLTITSRPLSAGEAFTIDLQSPSQHLAAYLEPGVMVPLSRAELANLILLGLAAVLLILALGRRLITWTADWHRRRHQTVVPQYEPPDGLSPAHMSILETPAADVADITATLIDLAVRGHLKIEPLQLKNWLHKGNYRLTKLDGSGALAPFESQLLSAIFKSDPSVETKNLGFKRTNLSTDLQAVRRQLGTNLKAAGYYGYSPTGYSAIWRVWLPLFVFGLGVSAAGLAYGDLPFAVVMSILTLALAAVTLWLAWLNIARTSQGVDEWAKIKGFKWYLQVAEKDRLNFTDAPERTPELFSKLLPYAVALKVEKQWAKQFAGIDVQSSVGGWYVGYYGGDFSAGTFTGSLSSSFGGAMSSTFGGASGAGGAGGGGGGGGGGGW